ncbi:hypothetical protein EYC98_11230 [Halieaceae bacterium IMCC14734]|uniref:Uncharacterized protein n=1 Tax=Candidatus Litorirhabdus singularis TaxID=2518993 RepID=A0ABT3TGV7_9GAMM|nr:hypothetical protein [Candidatus Litorirhabdus singularis]MCX2981435.1 hypothetical protein [Candidatus Litorirhabdus singularis]
MKVSEVVVTWVLIIFVVMVALSPLLSMRPSRHQRHLASLREQAALAGMVVQLQQLPDMPDSGLQPFYSRRRPREDKQPHPNVVYRRTAQGWLIGLREIPPEVAEPLAAMPEGVSHASASMAGIGVFWDETGNSEDLKLIDSQLRRLLGEPPVS